MKKVSIINEVCFTFKQKINWISPEKQTLYIHKFIDFSSNTLSSNNCSENILAQLNVDQHIKSSTLSIQDSKITKECNEKPLNFEIHLYFSNHFVPCTGYECCFNTNMKQHNMSLSSISRVKSTCLLSFRSKDLKILQQSDLKTPYGKDSVMWVLKISAWPFANASFKSISVLVPFCVTEACHLMLTSFKLSW